MSWLPYVLARLYSKFHDWYSVRSAAENRRRIHCIKVYFMYTEWSVAVCKHVQFKYQRLKFLVPSDIFRILNQTNILNSFYSKYILIFKNIFINCVKVIFFLVLLLQKELGTLRCSWKDNTKMVFKE